MLTELSMGRGGGHWMRVIVDELGDQPRWSAIIWCPECDRPFNLVNHSIAGDGAVTPLIGHPIEYPICHCRPKTVRLLNWPSTLPEISPRPKHECGRCHAQSREIGCWGIGWGYDLICSKCILEISIE